MKPKLKKITLDSEAIEKMNAIINSDYSDHSKHTKLRQIGIRNCLSCGSIATQQLVYQVGDKEQRATKIESYCDSCLTKSRSG